MGVAVVGVGLATPFGLGREATLTAWSVPGTGALSPNDRWPTGGFPRVDAGLVHGFNPRRQLPDRKAVKLMSRETRLGVFAAVEACGGTDVVERLGIEPARFGAYAAAGYEVSALADHEDMLAHCRHPDDAGRVSLARLFGEGRDRYNPLAPLRILPNMALFHAGVTLGLRGAHLALGSSPAAGLAALGEATDALDHDEADAALVLGVDAQTEEFRAHMLVEAGVVPILAPGEGAAALLLLPCGDGPEVLAWAAGQEPTHRGFGDTADGGAARRALYARVIEAAGGAVDLSLGDLWGDLRRDTAERGALPSGEHSATRPRAGWLGAAHGLMDVGIAAELVLRGDAGRVLVTASGVAGDIAAVVIGEAS